MSGFVQVKWKLGNVGGVQFCQFQDIAWKHEKFTLARLHRTHHVSMCLSRVRCSPFRNEKWRRLLRETEHWQLKYATFDSKLNKCSSVMERNVLVKFAAGNSCCKSVFFSFLWICSGFSPFVLRFAPAEFACGAGNEYWHWGCAKIGVEDFQLLNALTVFRATVHFTCQI